MIGFGVGLGLCAATASGSGSGDLKWSISTLESMPGSSPLAIRSEASAWISSNRSSVPEQQAGDVAPALFVDDHRDAAEMAVLELVEGALGDGLLDVVEDGFEHRAG